MSFEFQRRNKESDFRDRALGIELLPRTSYREFGQTLMAVQILSEIQ